MRKRNFKVTVKRIMVFWISIVLAIICAGAVACKKHDNITYKTELRMRAHCGTEAEMILATLTEEDSSYESTVGLYPFSFFKYQVELVVLEYKGATYNGKTVFSSYIYGYDHANYYAQSSEIDELEVFYTIENDEIQSASFDNSTYNISTKERMNGVVELEKSMGVHHIRYKIPKLEKYNTKAIEYDIKLIVEKDARQGVGKIEIYDSPLEDDVIETIKPSTHDENLNALYDIHIVKCPPAFEFVDAYTNQYVSNQLNISYRKLDAANYIDENKITMDTRGIYLCQVIYTPNTIDNYQTCVYYCYLVYV